MEKGDILIKDKKWPEACEVYEEIIRRFDKFEEIDWCVKVIEAFLEKGKCLGGESNKSEAIKAYEDVIKRSYETYKKVIKSSSSNSFKERLCNLYFSAWFGKGEIYRETGLYNDYEKALSCFTRVFMLGNRFGLGNNVDKTSIYVQACLGRVDVLTKLDSDDCHEEIFSFCEKVMKKIGYAVFKNTFHEEIGSLLVYMGKALIELNCNMENIETYEKRISSYFNYKKHPKFQHPFEQAERLLKQAKGLLKTVEQACSNCNSTNTTY